MLKLHGNLQKKSTFGESVREAKIFTCVVGGYSEI